MIRRALLALCLLSGCAKQNTLPSVFTTDWLNDNGHSIAVVEQSLRAAPKATNEPMVIGVTETALVGLPLRQQAAKWTHSAVPDTLPSVAGELVVYSSRGKLSALDAKSGAPRWSVDVGAFWLRGAGDDGTTTVATLGTSDRKKSLLLAVRRDGTLALRIETPLELGRPVARGGIAFVPWAGQYVSAIDIASGDERGRLLTRELVSHALNVDGELFFGEKAMLHFDERVRYASTNQGVRANLPDRVLPGRPKWLGSGSELPVVDVGAHSKVRIYASPVWANGETRFASGSFVATYFRAVMGLSAKTGELKWVRAFSSPVIGGGAARSGFVLCGADGQALFVSSRGSTLSSTELGTPLRACVVEANSLDGGAGAEPGSLAVQIDRALSALDPEMAAAEAFLVTELGRLEEPSVTKTLIDLSTSARMPPDIRLRARELLAQRRSGAELMLAALEHRYDFLSGELLPPPVGPLADALAAMGEKRAAPSLARHLNDPSTDSADLVRAARALVTLATPAELPDLRTFFALYRATADEPALIQAVGLVAQAIVRVGGAEGRSLVERAAKDPLTQPDVVKELASVSTG